MEENKILINYSQGLSRFSGIDALYRKYLLKFFDDPTFIELADAMNKEDYLTAFRCAHTLKGITGNLSLIALFEATVPFVEQLRDECDIQGAVCAWKHIQQLYSQTLKAIDNSLLNLGMGGDIYGKL